MAGYLVAQLDVTDAQAFETYRERVPAVIASHGGRYLVRGGAMEVVEGEWPSSRLVILEFPSLETARGFYQSPEYQDILPLRLAGAKGCVALVEGYQS